MIVLDTNVISELMRADADPAVMAWAGDQRADDFATTAVTKAEILYGLHLLPKGHRRKKLENSAEHILSVNLGGRIMAFDSDVASVYAVIGAARRAAGKPISEIDCQIAAIVRFHEARLATRNTKDFEDCGLKLINPWKL